MRPRPGVLLTPADIGARVTVRRVLPSGQLGDVVGVLLTWRDGRLTVRRRDDTVAEIEEGAIVAARLVGPTRAQT
jgi:hypothetical protein